MGRVKQQIITLLGKGVRTASRLRGGGGSALPGLLIEHVDPAFLARTLSQLPRGIVVISGTNGKTTTTKMVVELLQGQGLRVFTNRTGSNFTRGIVAAVIESVDSHGRLPFDIAVLELDEAYAVKFASQIQPTHTLLLNVLRDQLDRFGEIDKTAELLHAVALQTTDHVVINRDDPRLGSATFTEGVSARVSTYDVSPHVAEQFPSDDEMRGPGPHRKTTPHPMPGHDNTRLESFEQNTASIRYGTSTHTVPLKLKGIFNIQNATAAVALCRAVMGNNLNEQQMLTSLQNVEPAFGRGEDIMVGGQPVELVLVKNPSGFRLSLKSFNPVNTATMIAINDNYADGRDMSWLWDVDFESLKPYGVTEVSGIRAYDMALRLQYDEIEVKHIDTDIKAALEHFLSAGPAMPKRIYCTYTAMLALRKQLSKLAHVERVL